MSQITELSETHCLISRQIDVAATTDADTIDLLAIRLCDIEAELSRLEPRDAGDWASLARAALGEAPVRSSASGEAPPFVERVLSAVATGEWMLVRRPAVAVQDMPDALS